MAEVFFDNPPILAGDEQAQLKQLQRYLSTVSDKLNTALMTITIEQMAPETQQVIREAGGEKTQEQYEGLKTMIVKTAEVVRNEMDEIRTHLESNYEALSSDYGTFKENFTQDVTATATGVLQSFGYEQRISSMESTTGEMLTKLNSYIFMGVVRYENGLPVTGIAIGDGHITNDDGTIDTGNQMATFTAKKLSFYQNGIELAYFSNNVMHIANAEVTQSMKMGNHYWKVLQPSGALALIAGEASV